MTYLLYITAFLNVGLGLFTFVNKPKARTNIYFFLLSVGIASWAISNALFQESDSADVMHLWAVVAYIVASLMLYTVHLFSYSVTGLARSRAKKTISYFSLFVGSVLPLVPNLVSVGVNFEQRSIIGGPLLPLVFVSYLFLIIDSLVTLFKAQKVAQSSAKIQLRLVFWGLFGAIISGTFTNLVLPAVGIYDAVAIGPTFTLILLGIISYAIVRHRLFDIRVLVGRLIYYTTLALLPFSIFFILVYFYVDVFGSVFSPPVYLLSIPIAVGFVLMFNWINDILRNQVTTRLINPGYNPLETAERLSNELSVMIELPPIANAITSTLSRTVRPDFSAIVILPDEKHAADRTYTSDNRALADLTKLKNAVTTLWNTVGKHPIILEEIDIEVAEGLYRNVPNIAQELKAEMNHLGIRILLALGQDNVFGLFAIGQKEADSSYTNSDVEFLKSIANTGSLAVQRSLLYSEVQEFAQTLQKKVDDATTELKKANTDLQSALSQLQEARRVERDMIDVMGHELRTPISIVRNALVMMGKHQERNKHLTSEELKKYMDMALESTRREITMIETLLSATKVDNARIQLYLVKSDMVDMVDDAIEGQKVPISQKNLEIIFHRPPEPVWVYADRTRAQEITDNFLSNAVKYTLAGSVEINVWKDDKYGYTSIKDTGIGISEEDLQNLGKKFFRAKQHIPKKNGSDTEVVRPGGTGLGLYVTFDLIKIMGGSLYINSKVGEGTTFTFCLPSYVDQPEKQVDQTFDNNHEDTKANIFLNKAAPQPPEK